MAILIAGGLGYIGSNVSKLLLENEEDVIILDNLSNSHLGKAKLLKTVTNGKTIKLYSKDLLNEKDLVQIFKENQIESIIYTAESQEDDSIGYIKQNLLMLTNVLNIMETFNCKRLIFTSRDIYSESGSLKESSSTIDILNSKDIKSISSKLQEKILDQFFKKNKDRNYSISILRLFNVSGTDSSGMLGDISLKNNDMFTNLMRYNLNGEKIKLYSKYLTFDETLVRDYIHIKDVANAYLKTLEFIRKSTNYFDTFNICSGKPTSDSQIIRMYEIIIGTKVNYEILNKTIESISDKVGDKTKTNNILKFDNIHTLDSIIKNNFEFCKNYKQILKDFKESEKLIQKQNSKKKESVKDGEKEE
ncbi:NAD-dependent epimerase/dehydratase family protein [uncultured Clostridium sp.]|uniref:NAD-dependent epimerase/dehydratase family protein n=1 Tax=uncultured Clostridium sp. TaxID=59620 RepID=UPI002605A605|nr:NAD-dependent epimerase/dehydratase family protein [uncultured Clostridium sp.]